jgi:hypothetical protein
MAEAVGLGFGADPNLDIDELAACRQRLAIGREQRDFLYSIFDHTHRGFRHEARGWTLDVLNVVRSAGKKEFYWSDIYLRDEELARLHPKNLHVRDKIRQQLQRLRDWRFLEFLGGGTYRLKT